MTSTTKNKDSQKWYQQTGWIIALLILFFPVGLYLMWKYAQWNKVAKIAVSVFFGIVLFGGAFVEDENDDTTTTPQQEIASSPSPTPNVGDDNAQPTDEQRQLINAEIDYYDDVILAATELSQVTDEELLRPNGLTELNAEGSKLYSEATTRVIEHSEGIPQPAVEVLSEMGFYAAEAAMTASARHPSQLDTFNQNVQDYTAQKQLLLNYLAQ